jgi:hypothetical protein
LRAGAASDSCGAGQCCDWRQCFERTIGVPPDKVEELVRLRTEPLENLSESQKDTITLLKEKLDLNQRQVQSALAIVGEANVSPERLAAKLLEIAEQYKDLQTAAAPQPGDDAKIRPTRSRPLKMGSSEKRMNFWPRSKKSRPRNYCALSSRCA